MTALDPSPNSRAMADGIRSLALRAIPGRPRRPVAA
jgi:hypothetical protein